MNPVFLCKVESGRLIFENPQRYLAYQKSLEGKPLELVLRKRKTQRSNQQNKAYWGIVIEILSKELGYSKDEVHDALKQKFASRIDFVTGLQIMESTAKMNTKRFMEYYQDIQRWAAEFLNCQIPDPNEIDTENYESE